MVEFPAVAAMGAHSLVVLPGTRTLVTVVYRKADSGVLPYAWINLDLI